MPEWLENAVPYTDDNEPVKCLRYQFVNELVGVTGADGQSANDQYQHQCAIEASFNRSEVVACSEFVYKPDEVTIVNEVNYTM